MSVTHQYQIKDASNNILDCGNTNSISGLLMNDVGDVEYGAASTTVAEIIFYYIGSSGSAAPFQLVIAGESAAVIPSVTAVRFDTESGTAGFGGAWSVAAGVLNIYLDIPSAGDSQGVWQFGDSTPTLNLKVRVKRQTAGISCP